MALEAKDAFLNRRDRKYYEHVEMIQMNMVVIGLRT